MKVARTVRREEVEKGPRPAAWHLVVPPPYSIFWIALGCFWPGVTADVVEAVHTPDPAWRAWLPPQQEESGLYWLPPTLARQFVTVLARDELRLPTRANLERWGRQTIRVDDEGPYSLASWYAFFARRKQQLRDFLEQAIASNRPILCSL